MADVKEQDQPTEPGDGLAVPDDPDAAVEALREHWEGLATDDPEVTQERILRSILSASSPADLLRAGEATPARELVNVPLTITGIRASESEYDAGVDWYLHVDAVIKTNGDHVTVSCGARDVCIKLVAADMRGWFPLDAMFVQATKPTKAGFYPMFLRELPPDF